MTSPQPLPQLPYASATYSPNRNLDHLNLLAIFHYVAGGLTLLLACIPIIHVVIGLLMLSGKFNGPPGQPGPPPAVGWLFVIIGSVVICLGWALGLLIIYSGVCIKARRKWMFSVVIAGIMCLNVPLGVLTLVVLLRDSVKQLYGITVPPPYPAPPPY